MSPAMFGRAEFVGSVVITLVGNAGLFFFELEAFFGWPVNSLGVEWVRQIDDFAGWEFRFGFRASETKSTREHE
jgi:hypothetical protein